MLMLSVITDHSNVMQRTNLNTTTSLAWGNWLRDSLIRRLLCTTPPVCCFLTPVFSRSVVLNPTGEKLSSCYCRSGLNRCGSTKTLLPIGLRGRRGFPTSPGLTWSPYAPAPKSRSVGSYNCGISYLTNRPAIKSTRLRDVEPDENPIFTWG